MARVLKYNGTACELVTHEAAEALAGFRLDRRINYWIGEGGEVEEEGVYTGRCSGCSCGCEGGCSCGDGMGCRECGYTGRRRMYFGFPARTPEERKRDRDLSAHRRMRCAIAELKRKHG